MEIRLYKKGNNGGIDKMKDLRILPYKFNEVVEKDDHFVLILEGKKIGTVNKDNLDKKLLWLLRNLAMPER